MKKLFSTKNLAGMAIFSALSFVVYFLEFSIFPSASFLELDFSNVFVLLASFMYGPIGGLIVLIVKEALHIPFGGTGGIGELVNVLVGISFIALPSIVYLFKKGIKVVIITLSIACVIASSVAIVSNRFVTFPLFGLVNGEFYTFFWILVAFNLIKFFSVSIITFLLYKRLSFLFIKIHLKESKPQSAKTYISNSPNETVEIAKKYAKTLKKGDVVILYGDLGAGKTEFVKGVAERFNLTGVTSPTYAYLNIYGNLIYHYDCYRLSGGESAEVLGLTDYFNQNNICLIEWAENIKDVLPKNCKVVKIEKLGDNKRGITL